MYCFDRKLRSLIFSEIEKIEIAVRAKMIYILAHEIEPFWHVNKNNFKDVKTFSKSIGTFKTELYRSDADSIRNFQLKYSNPFPPSWIMLEECSFGTVSVLYSNLKPTKAKKKIAIHFGLNVSQFESWIHTLVYVRNVCAHHSRLWNKMLTISPQIPKTAKPTGKTYKFPSLDWIETTGLKNHRLYFVISIVAYFLQSINPNTSFKSKLLDLFKVIPTVDLDAMSFPKDWEGQPLWKSLN